MRISNQKVRMRREMRPSTFGKKRKKKPKGRSNTNRQRFRGEKEGHPKS